MLSRWISINQQEPLTRGALVIMFFSNIMVYSLNSNHLRNNRLCSASPRRFETNHDEVVYIINFEEIAYHQGKALYIIIAKELYSLRLMRYTLRVMIYSLTANDIPLLSQWIKKDDSEESSFLARRKGLEPLTFWFVARHSIQLSYRRLYGADDEARTRYLHLGKVALYQMSYIRKCKKYYTYYYPFCQ